MGRLGAFVWGVVIGGALVYGAMSYHVINTQDGLKVVPKVTAGFADTYVDIRGFGLDDWTRHRALAMALIKADKAELMGETASLPLRETLEGWLKGFQGENP
ncbi:MAG: hypothetical protein KJ000_11265 [Pirellulaceae bacterium]|nr:hypothetical protein [Pirellulaceae bacterium]